MDMKKFELCLIQVSKVALYHRKYSLCSKCINFCHRHNPKDKKIMLDNKKCENIKNLKCNGENFEKACFYCKIELAYNKGFLEAYNVVVGWFGQSLVRTKLTKILITRKIKIILIFC